MRPDEAEAPRELDLARIPQQRPFGQSTIGSSSASDVEALDERPRARVGVGVESWCGCPFRDEESGKPQHVGVSGPPDDHRSADAALEQADAPQDERAHDALPELGLRHQHVAAASAKG